MTAPDYAALAAAVAANPGDSDATAALLAANRGLVVSKAKQLPVSAYWNAHDWKDVCAEGDAALWWAAQLYDPTRGVQWSTYAGLAVDRAIRRWWHANSHPMPVGKQKAWARPAVTEALLVSPGASVDEVAEMTGLKPDTVRAIIDTSRFIELDAPAPAADDSDPDTLAEAIGKVDSALATAEEREAARAELMQVMAACAPPLTGRQVQVLALRHGFDGGQSRTQREVAEILNTTYQSVQQAEDWALKKLRIAAAKLAAEALAMERKKL